MNIYPGSVLGSEVQCIEQLQNGSLAMTKTSAAAMENFIPEMSVYGLPYVFRDVDHYWNVLKGPIGKGCFNRAKVNSCVDFAIMILAAVIFTLRIANQKSGRFRGA